MALVITVKLLVCFCGTVVGLLVLGFGLAFLILNVLTLGAILSICGFCLYVIAWNGETDELDRMARTR